MLGDSPADFTLAVRELLQDEIKRRTLGQNARNFALAEFDWNKNMAEFETLLQ